MDDYREWKSTNKLKLSWVGFGEDIRCKLTYFMYFYSTNRRESTNTMNERETQLMDNTELESSSGEEI